uniref:methylated-DNA--[protein]-cysteine S-methyltransferase n=1 Tax=Candidatus Kentrum sp. MB TaxID=2138164 RepID=A0A450XTL6_9GAMM|nr:MAG: O-6-methylguanine DNA methyltransferase [Candidatus Kentron sp. MB]VFK32602.1 MAG: O-6-methylguanine DNA methyltransferase [Candidatus Kentron sp. MB]VFK75994.1 MAG: O-6-methylguanine DNA methyltransferase [Candidatus Kentron sp. MB]
MLIIEVSENRFLSRIELLHQGREIENEIPVRGNNKPIEYARFLKKTVTSENAGYSVIANVIDQLKHYFDDPCWRFRLPLASGGTPFQKRVWQSLLSIPPGETRSYGRVATELHTSARAVGNACRVNPIPIVIPCHRVVGAYGSGGYMGSREGRPLATKQWLLSHESLHRRRKIRRLHYPWNSSNSLLS